MDKIKEALHSAGVEKWQILVTEIDEAQGYYIQNKQEMARILDSSKIEVTVFKDFEENKEKYKGSMSIELFPSMTLGEMIEKLKFALEGALSVKNKWYPMEENQNSGSMKTVEYILDKYAPSEWINIIAKDVTNIKGEDVHFNAFEIFITRKNCRFLNSNKLKYEWYEYSGLIEVVATSRCSGGEEAEVFDQFTFSDYDKENITGRIANLVKEAKDRAEAAPLPQLGNIAVILKGQLLYDFFRWFLTKGSAGTVYQGMSGFKTGKILQKEGDLISLMAVPFMEGSSGNIFIDKNGTIPAEVKIVESGIVENIVSDIQFGTYLGLPVTGVSKNLVVNPGSMRNSDYMNFPYLEAVEFSDFQVDPVTGNFGGEIRLAYYFDGNSKIPVTGGSVTGNIPAMLEGIRLSNNMVLHNGYRGPDFVHLSGASIAGWS